MIVGQTARFAKSILGPILFHLKSTHKVLPGPTAGFCLTDLALCKLDGENIFCHLLLVTFALHASCIMHAQFKIITTIASRSGKKLIK